MAEDRHYLIKKGAYFYREKWCGYTEFKFDAGRYTKEQAEAEASVEPWHMTAIHEDDAPDERAPDKLIAELRATIAALKARIIALEAKVPKTQDDLATLLKKAQAKFDAMSPEEKAAHRAVQLESFVRGMTTPCEHGQLDFEQCPYCRGQAI